MFRLLIFGGTTEGRELAELCAGKGISAAVSVTTKHGAELLPQGVDVFCGRLTADEMAALMQEGFSEVIDATHPYAAEAGRNIRAACRSLGMRYTRLAREALPIIGEAFPDMDSLIQTLHRSDGVILSTLGSKEAPRLTELRDHKNRVWLRVLPSESIIAELCSLGFDKSKIITGKGPFTEEQNVAHIRQSRAEILLTKESGSIGGYPEKAAACKKEGVRMLTLERQDIGGITLSELTRRLLSQQEDI